jgi:hypothetical protein
MDSMENFRERIVVSEQRTEPWQQHTRLVKRRRWWPIAWHVAVVAALGLALVLPRGGQAKTFRCSAGDVPCLIAAINEANANGEANTIRLAAGTYTLTAPDNPQNGLPMITSPLTITGRRAETTIIERDASAPRFRLLQVAQAGTLTLKRLTLRGGDTLSGGGGIRNQGTLTLVHTMVTANDGGILGGGGILNNGSLALAHTTVITNGSSQVATGGGIATSGGMVTITHSTIARNLALLQGGGLSISGGTVTLHATTVTRNFAEGSGGITNGFADSSGGTVIITESAITNNAENCAGPAGIANSGTMIITNTTIAANSNDCRFGGGGGIGNFGGTLLLTNSTLADNAARVSGGGIVQRGGTVLLLNTILAQNIGPFGPDCAGSITSLGTNLIGDPTGCSLTLQPSDLTGAPGLDTFTDNGRPGKGHFPLLPMSQAIDAGTDALCPRTDQLGRRRIGPCDIGAIEFRERDDRQPDEEDDQPDEDQAAAAH